MKLYSGTSLEYGGRVLILIKNTTEMAISYDFGDEDPWRLKENIDITYSTEPLDLELFDNLKLVWEIEENED